MQQESVTCSNSSLLPFNIETWNQSNLFFTKKYSFERLLWSFLFRFPFVRSISKPKFNQFALLFKIVQIYKIWHVFYYFLFNLEQFPEKVYWLFYWEFYWLFLFFKIVSTKRKSIICLRDSRIILNFSGLFWNDFQISMICSEMIFKRKIEPFWLSIIL